MVRVIQAASYIYQRYREQFGSVMDEMKLHKMLYLAQRESLVQTDTPLFPEQFQAWRYGPVMVSVRYPYKEGELEQAIDAQQMKPYLPIFDVVFQKYAAKDSWSLSTLTHGEYSWAKAREGYAPGDYCRVPISTDDIRKDAERIKVRRILLRKSAVI